jgi:hypothetical protein
VNARRACPTVREVGFALARELGTAPEVLAAADVRLDAIAHALGDARLPGAPELELLETGRVLDEWLAPESDAAPRVDLTEALLPDVLVGAVGDEPALVMAALAACDRAGLPFGAVASRKHIYLAHRELAQPYLLAPRLNWRFIEATDLREGKLTWLCPHELAKVALDQALERASEIGRLDLQLRVSEMRVDLPLDHTTLHDAQNELAMARARFN